MKKVTYTVISLYKFFEIKKIFNFKNKLLKIFYNIDVKGIILIAPEGININISLVSNKFAYVIKELQILINFNISELKKIENTGHIFRKFKIKIKKEILTTRMSKKINLNKLTGKYVEPENWDLLISDPNTILVDMRNNYEVNIGTFNKALNPKCNDFTGLLKWLEKELMNIKNIEKKNVAMFCTGGIRCEKASSFLLNLGKKNVYQLHGGILKYLEGNRKSKLWKGECFVFDNRVSLNKNLRKGSYFICHACRMPLKEIDKKRNEYVEGEACHLCYDIKTEEQKKKYRMRNNQIKIKREN
ncbi:MAG: hypothetical protein CFH34_00534 [Alphaproteobacteria bacterium MarineAlpha9_Bin4]|nr:MAG: hypothetical protein CFH34_00534 [Alphaproteobacteria bacterium MarineAlpha9_Bin4]|tara:strand:+ start:233 stop:1135 length:903 start_codon:yes stop_codon:yes gene_type:complete